MKGAADALYVSPGAISQQIKNLEDRLGVRLFTRTNREVALTNAGRALFDQLSRSFDEIEQTWSNSHGANRQPARLVVTTTVSFAGAWLVPRLGRFKNEHPDIEVTIESTARLIDLRRGHADVAIRHGLGDYPGHAVFRIWTPELLPVCSPHILRADKPIARPEDCLCYPLLQDIDRADWTLWLKAHGIDDRRAQRGSSFNDDSLLVKAAVAGQGLALVRDVYVQDEIAAGRLVRVLDLSWPTQFAYYGVCSSLRKDEWKIVALRNWIHREMEQDKVRAASKP